MVSTVTAPVFTMPPLHCFLQGLRGGGGAQLNSSLLRGIAWCFFHIVASPGWGCFQPCSYGPALTVTSPSGISSLLLLSWPFFILMWSSWPLSGLLLLERAPKCFSFHCSQHPTLPSSCEDAKDFLLNANAVRSGMGTLGQLNPSLLFAQAPRLPPCSWVPPQYF